jgi:hypothetical protein
VSDVAPLDPGRIINTLARHEVRYVLVGALAARLYGLPRLTADLLDITPSLELDNLKRLSKALRELDARVFTESVPEGLPFDCSAPTLSRASLWNLTTNAGRIDLVFKPSGTEGYDDLTRDGVRFLVFGEELLVASLPDLIRSKEASGRPQDRQDVILLNEILRKFSPD